MTDALAEKTQQVVAESRKALATGLGIRPGLTATVANYLTKLASEGYYLGDTRVNGRAFAAAVDWIQHFANLALDAYDQRLAYADLQTHPDAVSACITDYREELKGLGVTWGAELQRLYSAASGILEVARDLDVPRAITEAIKRLEPKIASMQARALLAAPLRETISAKKIATIALIRGRDGRAADCARKIFEACGAQVREFDDIKARHQPPSGLPMVHNIAADDLFHDVDAVCVVLAPEEEVVLLNHLRSVPEDGLKCVRPRPNVLYEAGLAVKSRPGRVLPLRFGLVDLPSDLHGVFCPVWSSPQEVYRYVHDWLANRSDSLHLAPLDETLVEGLHYESRVQLTDEERRAQLVRYVREYDKEASLRMLGAVGRASEAYRRRLFEWRSQGKTSLAGGSDLYKSELRRLYSDRADQILVAAQAIGLDLERFGAEVMKLVTQQVYLDYRQAAAKALYQQMVSEDPSSATTEQCEVAMHNAQTTITNDLGVRYGHELRRIIRDRRIGLA